ncbi:hypothetical protein ACQI5H_22695 [Mycobacterium heidelbergense]|uniref:hypothetical protein n=1 Tax=Mycobacterium heidelbergense TaxID=53376 RepID=UPI003CE9127E
MSDADALEAASHLIEAAPNFFPAVLLLVGDIDTALAVEPPAGDPDVIAAQADTYQRVEQLCQQVIDDELAVNKKSLPASWHGQAAESATQALSLLALQAIRAQGAFAAAAKALATWADQLRTAQSQDAHGQQQLQNARTQLGQPDLYNLDPSILQAIKEAAAAGCHQRWEAARLAAGAAGDASTALRPWPGQARAQQIRVPGVDALTAVTLAYDHGGGGAPSPTANMLASKQLDAMSPADRAAFEKLLADASSPAEAEYLWKAASAGYNLDQLQSFGALIHPHGNDSAWLQKHLDGRYAMLPDTTDVDAQNMAATFSQGQDPDCVAASTVMARLRADPVLMMGTTTGQGPAAVGGANAGDDSRAAITARAQTLFTQNYAYGRTAEGDDAKTFLGITYQDAAPPGIGPTGAIALDNKLLTPVTGSTYEYQPLNNAADRQAALPKIEAAAQAGQPVPLDVRSSSAAHQMVIEDYDGSGDLEIHNPWGSTQWVPTQQFVDGQLGALTDNGRPGESMPDPYGVALPQQ